jgi:hypothetical protein
MAAIRYQTGNTQKTSSSQPFRARLSIWLKFSVLCAIVVAASNVSAKRVAPLPVQPVELNGMRYEAPHFCVLVKPQLLSRNGDCPNGGIVQAIEIHSGQVLWTVRVYETQYDERLERDVQDVFITGLRIEGDHLIVKNERGNIYKINLLTRELT